MFASREGFVLIEALHPKTHALVYYCFAPMKSHAPDSCPGRQTAQIVFLRTVSHQKTGAGPTSGGLSVSKPCT